MKGERILVVDDEKIIAFDLKRRLKSFGLQVVGTCGTGAEALDLAKRERPDLVLMDIMLEGDGDGIAAARQIMDQLQIPSVFLTAYSDPATLERAKAAQPLAYIIKPFKERELFTTLEVALAKGRAEAQLRDQERWLAAILNTVSDALIALTGDQRIHYASPAAAALLDIMPSELIGLPLGEVLTLLDETTQQPLPLWAAPAVERQETLYFRQALLRTAAGAELHVEGSLSRIKFDRMPIGQVLTLRDVSSVRRLAERLEFQHRHDTLTGLVNRQEFTDLLTRVHVSQAKQGVSCALLALDLDQFRLVNDTGGHLAGDELLRVVARILYDLLDTTATAVGRIGADEFAFILENCSPEQALETAWIVKHRLNSHEFSWGGTGFKLKASLGLVALDPRLDDVKEILAAADDACALAKEEGGNRIKVYAPEEAGFRQRRGEMTWIARLNRALETDRFVLYRQAIEPLDPVSGLRPKAEVLIRLLDEGDRLVPPADFIPAAERYNLMPQIDRWVIRHALAAADRVAAADPRRPVLCLNLSGQSIGDPNLVSFIRHEFKRSGASPGDYCFEITETATIGNLSLAVALIEDLKALGCSFALDDFGSGFSSFGYLRNLPVDTLKIDGVFVKNIDTDAVNFAMVEGIQKISRVMGLKTIAEFAATDSVLATLRTIGIDYAQGYALQKPLPL